MKAWTSDFSATPIPLMCCRLYGEVCPLPLRCRARAGRRPAGTDRAAQGVRDVPRTPAAEALRAGRNGLAKSAQAWGVRSPQVATAAGPAGGAIFPYLESL